MEASAPITAAKAHHACLLVPVTSCQARNTRLDRRLLTRTVLGEGFPLLARADLRDAAVLIGQRKYFGAVVSTNRDETGRRDATGAEID